MPHPPPTQLPPPISRHPTSSGSQDNNSIYYDPVPEADVLDPLADPVVMMKPLASEDEQSVTKVLSFKPTGSPEISESEGGAETASSGEGESGLCKMDEEIARELHDKLNT